MKCPICAKTLVTKGDADICPDLHGALLDGGELMSLEATEYYSKVEKTAIPRSNSIEALLCPNCNSTMHKVEYGPQRVVIDSCVRCPFRWLDKGEIATIISAKESQTDLDAETLIGGLGYDVAPAHELPSDKVPHFNAIRSIYALSNIFGNQPLRSDKIITTLGLYGMLKMAMHSWTYRVLLIIFLLFFGLMVLYVKSEFSA